MVLLFYELALHVLFNPTLKYKCKYCDIEKREREEKKSTIVFKKHIHTHKHYKVSLAGWHNEGRLQLKEKLIPLLQILSGKNPLP